MKNQNHENPDKYADLMDYDWNYDSLPNRMPLAQRAKIFLPFAALTGFDQALEETLRQEITEMEEKHSQTQDFDDL